jgi:hypothetical protein
MYCEKALLLARPSDTQGFKSKLVKVFVSTARVSIRVGDNYSDGLSMSRTRRGAEAERRRKHLTIPNNGDDHSSAYAGVVGRLVCDEVAAAREDVVGAELVGGACRIEPKH